MQACFNGTALNCPQGMAIFQCMDAINVAIGNTSAYANGNICNPDPGIAIPAICWRSGGPGNRKTPPPSKLPGPVMIDVTSRDGTLWHTCYIGSVPPPIPPTILAKYSLPADAPGVLTQFRNNNSDPLSEYPYNCHDGEQ